MDHRRSSVRSHYRARDRQLRRIDWALSTRRRRSCRDATRPRPPYRTRRPSSSPSLLGRPRHEHERLDMEPDLRRRLNLAADLLRRHPFRCWSYGDSVGFEGLVAGAELLSRPDVFGFAHGYLRGWAARCEPFEEIDNTAPGHAACMVYEQTGDALLLQGLDRLATWLCTRPRIGTTFTTFARSCIVQPLGTTRLSAREAVLVNDPGPGVYVDCLHFDPPFLTHLGRLLGSASLILEGVRQAEGYIDLLYDPESGLFRHFYLDRMGRAYVRGWGRGQGWAILGLLDVIEQLDEDDEKRHRIVEVIRCLAHALRVSQRPDGHWYTIVDDPQSGDESSTAAFVAAAFWKGIELGVLETESFSRSAEKA